MPNNQIIGKLANEMMPVRSETYRITCNSTVLKLVDVSFIHQGHATKSTYYRFTGTIRYPITLNTTFTTRKINMVMVCIIGGTVPQPTF